MLNIPEEIKDLLRQDRCLKNVRVHFPNGERSDITCDNIEADSFSFTEPICSRNKLKFGLCEASIAEFTTVGIGNIKGYEIEVYHEIDISSLTEDFIAEHGTVTEDVPFPYYRIPYGRFTVDTCPRQSDMTKRKVTAYSSRMIGESNYSEAELFKRSFPVPTNETYSVNLYNFLASSITGMIPDGAKTILEPDVIVRKYYGSIDNDGRILRIETTSHKWSFEGDSMKNLYYIETQNDTTFKQKIADATEQLTPYWVGAGLSKMKILDQRKLGYSYWVADVDGDVDTYDPNGWNMEKTIKNITCYYPYVSDTAGISSSIEWIAGIIVTITDSSGVEEISVSVMSDGMMNVYQVDREYSDIDNILISIPRIETTVNGGASIFHYSSGYVVQDDALSFRKITEAYAELSGLFGGFGRNGEFDFISLNSSVGLYPSETLYPADDLYPIATETLLTKSMYKSAWYDDEYTRLYSKVICTYKDSETQEDTYAEHIIVEVEEGEEDKYQIYDISDNYLIKENTFTEAQITEILSTLASNIDRIRYMPAEIDLRGLPYLEAGDVVQVLTTDGGFETIVLRRTLTGIQALSDNFESRG